MARARVALPLAALVIAACPWSEPIDGPEPVAVTPSRWDGLADLPIVIVGDHFDAAVQTDFEEGSGTLAATFQARLRHEPSGAAIALQSVRLTAARTLEAIVPSLPPVPLGSYTLEVTDPAGRTGVLPQAFRVVNAAANLVGFRVVRIEEARSGVPFLVELTALDATATTVDGFEGSVQLTDLTGTVAPATVGPFVLGQLAVRVTVTAAPLPYSADVITATSLPPLVGRSGASAPFDVTAGPPVALVFAAPAPATAAGACSDPIWIETRDALGNPSPVSSDLTVELQSSPAGSLTFHLGGGGCTSPVTPSNPVVISAGSSTAAFRYTGPTPGAFVIRAVPAALPSATLDVILD